MFEQFLTSKFLGLQFAFIATRPTLYHAVLLLSRHKLFTIR